MGRIKSMVIKRTSRQLMEQSEDSFEKDFEHNKKALGRSLPSKKMRNRIAGYVTRLKKQKKTIIEDEDGSEQQSTTKTK
jgi:small subunit ribosomal protein S17e